MELVFAVKKLLVCVEDLCLKGWIGLAGKSTHDAGVGQAINQLSPVVATSA